MWNIVAILVGLALIVAVSTLLTKHTVNVAIRQNWRPVTLGFAAYIVGIIAGVIIALIFVS